MKRILCLLMFVVLSNCGESDKKASAKTSCGDGFLSQTETCDPGIKSGPGTCPTSCENSTSCSVGILFGSAETCDVICQTSVVSQCVEGDNCCPAECNTQNDSDCSLTCGDGVVDEGETCDGDCQTCDDNDACTVDSDTGSEQNCSLECTHDSIVACVDGDGCCPSACDEANDADCKDSCGDGILVAGEVCDGDCPTSCDDQDLCTIDSSSGRPDLCNVVCINTPISECRGDDGCCPQGCTFANDSDCNCTPKICAADSCGLIADGCGASVNCGGCSNGKSCENNKCVISTKESTGGTCDNNNGCETDICLENGDFVDGFCSALCTSDFDCEQGSHCVDMPGYKDDFCAPHCQADNDCRPGGVYGCWDPDEDGNNECVPKPTGNSTVGGACTGLSDCDSWSDLCLPSAPGGYCFSICILNFDCPGDTVCLNAAQGVGHCAVRCEQTSDCRSGYLCRMSTNNITGEVTGVCD